MLEKGKGKRKHSDDSEEEHIPHQSKLMKKLGDLEEKMAKILLVNPHLPLPLGLSSVLTETLSARSALAAHLYHQQSLGSVADA